MSTAEDVDEHLESLLDSKDPLKVRRTELPSPMDCGVGFSLYLQIQVAMRGSEMELLKFRGHACTL